MFSKMLFSNFKPMYVVIDCAEADIELLRVDEELDTT
jgi:hypothetical protein